MAQILFSEGVPSVHRYQNRSGKSGVLSFRILKTAIHIQFRDGTYVYNYKKPGKNQVEKMKTLALKGSGLSAFISRYVRENYFSKIK